MKSTVTQVFKTVEQASAATDQLLAMGIPNRDISVLMSDDTHGKDFKVEVNSKGPEGVAIGATAGGALGAIAAGLTAVGTVSLTGGIGLIAAGPMVAALAGLGAGAASGGLVGGLIGLGIDENEAKQTEHDIANGSVLVACEVPGNKKSEVKKLMKKASETQVRPLSAERPVQQKRAL